MRLLKTLQVSSLAVIAWLAFSGCGSAPLTTKVFDEAAFEKSTGIAVLSFSGEDTSLHYKGNVDSLGRVIARYVQREIQTKAGWLAVQLGDSGTATTYLIVDGRFTTINEGTADERVLLGPLGEGGVTVAVKGTLRRPNSSVIAEFSKSKTSSGGPIGLGGILAGDSGVIIDDIMREIAEDLAEFVIHHVAKPVEME
jgi:hypothetical protein